MRLRLSEYETFIFLSTPSARRATVYLVVVNVVRVISIHALREEGDQDVETVTSLLEDFYPRPPRGGRPVALPTSTPSSGFLSTPSARRATYEGPTIPSGHPNFYPRPPRGGRPARFANVALNMVFLSTPSARRATQALTYGRRSRAISIHALREEGDSSVSSAASSKWISIHALREEGDDVLYFDHQRQRYFYPRPPRGGRQQKQRQNLYFQTNCTTFCTNLEEP